MAKFASKFILLCFLAFFLQPALSRRVVKRILSDEAPDHMTPVNQVETSMIDIGEDTATIRSLLKSLAASSNQTTPQSPLFQTARAEMYARVPLSLTMLQLAEAANNNVEVSGAPSGWKCSINKDKSHPTKSQCTYSSPDAKQHVAFNKNTNLWSTSAGISIQADWALPFKRTTPYEYIKPEENLEKQWDLTFRQLEDDPEQQKHLRGLIQNFYYSMRSAQCGCEGVKEGTSCEKREGKGACKGKNFCVDKVEESVSESMCQLVPNLSDDEFYPKTIQQMHDWLMQTCSDDPYGLCKQGFIREGYKGPLWDRHAFMIMSSPLSGSSPIWAPAVMQIGTFIQRKVSDTAEGAKNINYLNIDEVLGNPSIQIDKSAKIASSSTLPRKGDGVARIVFISDTHGALPAWIDLVVQIMQQTDADALLFGGDGCQQSGMTPFGLKQEFQALDEIQKRTLKPQFAVGGNHDTYLQYCMEGANSGTLDEDCGKELGFKVTADNKWMVGESQILQNFPLKSKWARQDATMADGDEGTNLQMPNPEQSVEIDVKKSGVKQSPLYIAGTGYSGKNRQASPNEAFQIVEPSDKFSEDQNRKATDWHKTHANFRITPQPDLIMFHGTVKDKNLPEDEIFPNIVAMSSNAPKVMLRGHSHYKLKVEKIGSTVSILAPSVNGPFMAGNKPLVVDVTPHAKGEVAGQPSEPMPEESVGDEA